MRSTRRTFIRNVSSAGVVSIGAGAPAFLDRAALAGDRSAPRREGRILVLVQLEGGNDGLNTVIPIGDPEYQKLRPGIGIAAAATLKLDDDHALHPAMLGIKELFDDGALGVVQGVGYANPDRSHFRSMDIWNSARLSGELTRDGWLGRALDLGMSGGTGATPGAAPALAIGSGNLPLALVAAKTAVPMIRDIDEFKRHPGVGSERAQQRRRAALEEQIAQAAPAGSELEFLRAAASNSIATAKKLESLTDSYHPSVDYPSSPLAAKLKTFAQLIAADFGTRIFFVSLGGFDTHSSQEGSHQALLAELSGAITAFHKDLAGHGLGDRVLLATYSEFDRRAKENGSLGTDHGTASQMFFSSSDGKGIIGAHPSLSDLDEEGDLKYHTDFRCVYATLLDRWLGVPSADVLGEEFQHVGVV
jgi:uncharacterized protein (DUF1501 family)